MCGMRLAAGEGPKKEEEKGNKNILLTWHTTSEIRTQRKETKSESKFKFTCNDVSVRQQRRRKVGRNNMPGTRTARRRKPTQVYFCFSLPNLFFTCFSFSLADDWVPPGGALSSPPRCVAGPGRVCVPPVCKHADSRRSCIRSQWRCCWCWATCFRRSFDVRNRSNQKRLGAIDCRHDQRTPKRRDGISARLQERIRPELMIR